jgi:alkylation response protein AidB-like acyl-CoA dehydrogenase
VEHGGRPQRCVMLPDLGLTRDGQAILERASALAADRFAPRAAEYDRTAAFPIEDFRDLFDAGLHAAAVPREHGGLGLGPYRQDVLTLWMITREFAKADLSLARCWEGHVNSLVLLDGLATEEQKARWFDGVVNRGETWVAWSGEPQVPAPGETVRFGTTVTIVPGGLTIDGTKVFATSAGGARWAILLVSQSGAGGARHARSPEDVIMVACDLSDPSVSFDPSWWNPIGMRATASHLVRFNGTFIPSGQIIGRAGQYLSEGWQTCFTPHYAASFLGAAEAAYLFAVDLLGTQRKGGDPFVQQHVGQMAINVETAHLWLQHVARLWDRREHDAAKAAGIRARFLIEGLAEDTVKRAIRACGARSLNRPSALERIYRDLSFYVRHDNADHILATVGASVLGRAHDQSFFAPIRPDPER